MKSINHAHLGNSTIEHFVKYLEQELELKVLEAYDELLLNTVSQYATENSEKSKPTYHHCNKTKTIQKSKPSTEETEKKLRTL